MLTFSYSVIWNSGLLLRKQRRNWTVGFVNTCLFATSKIDKCEVWLIRLAFEFLTHDVESVQGMRSGWLVIHFCLCVASILLSKFEKFDALLKRFYCNLYQPANLKIFFLQNKIIRITLSSLTCKGSNKRWGD